MDIAVPPSMEGFDHIDGNPVNLYTIRSPDKACQCTITNYGARIVSLQVPDMAGVPTDIVLGYNSLKDYLCQPEEYMGAIVGRCANRIAAGLFVLEGHTYALPVNKNHNTLNGGVHGLHGQIWSVLKTADEMLVLTYRAKDGEEGFPGNVDIEVIYRWTDHSTFQITYHAVTDKSTLINLSNHSYFNLSGEGSDTVLDHELQIAANAFTPVNDALIPTGRIEPVANTSFDFRTPRQIGEAIDTDDQQLRLAGGLDHNFVLNAGQPALVLRSPSTGICMQIKTDRPGMQVYSGNLPEDDRRGKSGRSYKGKSALVVQPQGFPDAIHHPQFPSVVLRPGEIFHTTSEYHFSA